MDSLYVAQFSPTEDFKAVYKGSRSMRGGRLLDFTFVPRVRDLEDITGVEELMDPAALSRPGSMSTMLREEK